MVYYSPMKTSFSEKVRELALAIPKGRVTTYGHLARAAGAGGKAARSITGILAKSPDVKKIPFHRIVYANGRAWISEYNKHKRKKLYKKEGILIDDKGYIKNFADVLYPFD